MKVLLLVLVPAIAFAQPKVATVLDDLVAVHQFEQVAISDDGKRVAWVESIIEKGHDTGRAAVYALDVASKRPAARIGVGRHIAWSHDGTRLAYIDTQLYVATIGGGTRKLTKLAGYKTDPAWSPDDKQIAMLFAEQAATGGGPLFAAPAGTGVIGDAIHNQRLTVVDVRSGAAKQLSSAELHIYEYDWSPDGSAFVATAAPGPGDNNWWIAQLYTVPVATGAMTSIYKPALQIAFPRWSPDGATIGFIEGLMSDEASPGGDAYTIAATGGAPVDRMPNRTTSANTLAWRSPTQLLITELTGGSSAIATIDVSTRAIDRLWQGNEWLGAEFAASRDGKTVAAVRSDYEHAAEIWAGPIGAWQPLTKLNVSHHSFWGEAKSISWTNDGLTSQGWLVYPRDFDATKTYPMVVSAHGGPGWMEVPIWPGTWSDVVLSAFGYFVLLPNPRGSFGQGEAFARANVKDLGTGPLRDILAGVDAALKLAPIDPNRLGITGWSYGGYMSMWAPTQTNRFKAAVAGAGISNWQSYYGENAIDQWMVPFFGASVYDDPAGYAKASPITFVKRSKTPTLFLVGERDGECPPPQSYEMWHALHALGVATELVVYAGEGHEFLDTAHMRDRIERKLAWFDKYLK